MQEIINTDILAKPIKDLPFSDIFKQWAAKHKWQDLNHLLNIHAGDLQQRKGFTMHLYMELTGFLQQNQLLHLLKQRRVP